ncbi:gluconokinase [Variovorax sp. UMC13]|uniref:gluconokinase n=1 Tax=Variovorax sp. UMC13 TaxID=1862326 RepID=UPI001602925E|nr:FGGY family carbohydrate kinase [Variovorax sp. UMC13]
MSALPVATAFSVLAIDIGTSSVRAALFDPQGHPLGAGAQRTHRLETGQDGRAELDARALLDNIGQAIDEALQTADPGIPIRAVGLSSFWHSLVGLDAQMQPVTPVLTWADRRAQAVAAARRADPDAAALHARTGCPAHSSYWSAKLPWLRTTDAEAWQAACRWASACDLLMHTLFGGDLRTSTSMASGTGLFDLHDQRWSAPALSRAGLASTALPMVDDRPREGLVEAYARRWPQLASIPWFPAVGDGACSNVGVGSTDPDSMVLMLGTSGSMRVMWNAGDDRALSDASLWCYRVDAHRLVGGMALSEGGASAAWARETLAGGTGADLEVEIARMRPDAHGLTVLPFVLGARSPDWVDGRTACIAGITAATTSAQIYRAVLESVGLRFAFLKQRLERSWPAARRIVVTGGALSRSAVWRQIVADCIGQEIEVSDVDEGSLRGAALLTLERIGQGALASYAHGRRNAAAFDADAHAVYRQAMQRQAVLDALLREGTF